MFEKLRSLIFKLDPETAHNLAIKALKFNKIPNFSVDKNHQRYLETKLYGKKISNPIGVAAGFDKNAEVYNSLFNLNFGFVEVGTVTPLKQYGNPKPRVFRLEEDEALINRLGFNNSGADIISKYISDNKPNGLLGVNIGPNKDTKDRLNDYSLCFNKFHNICDYLTINISSPNTENLRDFHDNEKLDNLLGKLNQERIKIKSSIPLLVKISPDINHDQIENICEIIFNNKINGIILSNTTDKNRAELKNLSKHQKGGLSGKPLEVHSNILINKFYKIIKNKIPIIGVGGVDSGMSAYEKFISGASFVQLYTGMVYRGPNVVSKISKELTEILANKGIKNYQDIIGTK